MKNQNFKKVILNEFLPFLLALLIVIGVAWAAFDYQRTQWDIFLKS